MRVAAQVDINQFSLGADEVALVLAVGGPAIRKKMLGRARDMAGGNGTVRRQLALQSQSHGSSVGLRDFRVLAVALIGATPAVISRNRQGRAEGPVGPRHSNLHGGRFSDPADKVRIAGGTQTDIVGKHGRPDHIVVAVNGVDTEDQGNGCPLSRGIGATEGPGEFDPCLRRGPFVPAGRRITPGEDGSKRIDPQIFGSNGPDIGLDHLADLLLDGQPRKQVFHKHFRTRVRQGGRRR